MSWRLALASKTSDVSMIFIVTRGDGAVVIGRDKTASTDALSLSDDDKIADGLFVSFAWRGRGVLAGPAVARLFRSHRGERRKRSGGKRPTTNGK
jgi:hypothetical protein